ncbi:MAG: hypothetical protein HYW47_04035 [Deltaproteobacteria bacterium]|nr:hypothetical protein [Deltaproteobacteria bacterium]
MENKICEVKGQALIELCLILIILIPLCIVGLQKIGVLGDHKIEKEKNRSVLSFPSLATGTSGNPDSAATLGFNLESLNEEEFEIMADLPHNFEKYEGEGALTVGLGEKVLHTLEGAEDAHDAFSYYKEQFLKQGWEVKNEMGWFVFEKEASQAYLWQDEKNLFLFFY